MTHQSPPTELDEIKARLAALEAREEIAGLIAAYGPAVDAGAAEDVAALWSPEGTYSYVLGDETVTLAGRTGLRAMVRSEGHQRIITGGAGHVLSAPVITVDGDAAVATCYSMLVRHDPQHGRFYVDRLSSNRWELRRETDGWRITSRVNELLDGRESARALLGRSAATSDDPPAGGTTS